jgi:hypothetical protein
MMDVQIRERFATTIEGISNGIAASASGSAKAHHLIPSRSRS